MTVPGVASRESPTATIAADLLLGGIALALVLTVLDAIDLGGVTMRLHYKSVWRALPLVWLAGQAVPALRPALAPRWRASDVPLALFMAAAALSVWLGGGRWGDVRHLLAAIGVGLMARSLFADRNRESLLVHYLGGTVVLILARELFLHPDLLPPHELGRYALITANANVLGFLFGMVLPILSAEMFASAGLRRGVAGLYALAALLGILLTFSRTAAAGAGLGAAVLVLLALPRRRGLLILAAVALVFLAVQRPDRWLTLRTTGDVQRLRILGTSLTLVAEHPVLGVGFGINNLERVFPDRYEARYGERVFRFHSMNQLVDLLVGTGMVGTALALWWMARIAAAATRRWRRATGVERKIRAAGGLAALAAIAVMSMGEPPLYHGKLLPVLFLVLASLELDETRKPQEVGSVDSANEPSGRLVRTPA